MNHLRVFFEQRVVGTIEVDKSGPTFTYDPDWVRLKGAFPISTTMPFKSERFAPDIFLPWAANLLPESEQLRTLGQLLGMSAGDVIGLLSAIGGDTAGALSIGPAGKTRRSSMGAGGRTGRPRAASRRTAEQALPCWRGGRLDVACRGPDKGCRCD